MRNFLIRFFNDRNKEQRLMTKNSETDFDLFYKDSEGVARKVHFSLEVQGRTLFVFCNTGEGRFGELLTIVGEASQKLVSRS